MNKKWNRLVATLLAVLMVGALTCITPTAVAANTEDTNNDENKLTSVKIIRSGEGEFAEELAEAALKVDVYQVAGDTREFQYNLMDKYKTLTVPTNEEGWKEFAQKAAELAMEKDTPVKSGVDSIEGLTPGLYLLIPRGTYLGDNAKDYMETVTNSETGESTICTIARSSRKEFLFSPILIALPELVTTEADGVFAWNYDDVEVTLKCTVRDRFGKLNIVKTLANYENSSDALFIFEIKGELDGQPVFHDMRDVNFNAPGTKTLVVDKIPVGAKVTVTEVYSGAAYELVTANDQTATIDASENGVTVSFKNDYDRDNKNGYGITNNFKSNKTDNGWSWDHHQLEDNTAG